MLTEALAQRTPDSQRSTKAWAEWFALETFNDPELEALVTTCGRYAERFEARLEPSWLTLLGTRGTGKTKCARRLWNYMFKIIPWHVLDFDYMPGVVFWPALVRDLRRGERFDELAEMSNWPALFLDDIGAERDTTGFAAEQLNTLLGCRVGKWTIITGNLSLAQLGGIDPRISDRIIREQGNLYIHLTTESYGIRKAKNIERT